MRIPLSHVHEQHAIAHVLGTLDDKVELNRRVLNSHPHLHVMATDGGFTPDGVFHPGELLGIREKDIDLENGYIFIPHPKEKRSKLVPMLAEDIHLLRQMPRGFPEQLFFRSAPGEEGVAPNVSFNEKRLYKWWKRACANLGVEEVDLYGGTRHSSARALRRQSSPEQIKRATMHSTNQAFERCFQMEGDDLREIHAGTRADKTLIRQSGTPGK